MTDLLARAAEVVRDGEPSRWVPLPGAPDVERLASRTRSRLEAILTRGGDTMEDSLRQTLRSGLLSAYLEGRRSLGDEQDPTDAQRAALDELAYQQAEVLERVMAGPLAQAVRDARDGRNLRTARSFRTFAQTLAVEQQQRAIRLVYAAARRLAEEQQAALLPGSEDRMRARREQQARTAAERLAELRKKARRQRRLVEQQVLRRLERATEDERGKVWRGERGPEHLGEVLAGAAVAAAVWLHDRTAREAARLMANAYGVPEEDILSSTDPSDAEERVGREGGEDRPRWLGALGAGWLAWRMLRWARKRLVDDVTGRNDRTAAAVWMGRNHVVQAGPVPNRVVLAYWTLGNAEHCADCIRLSAMSPYRWEQLLASGILPGSGATRCGGHCRCIIELEVPA